LLFPLVLVLLSEFELVFQIILTLLIGKYLKIAELTNLFHFLPIGLRPQLLLFLIERFLPISDLVFHIILDPIESLIENSAMFDIVGNVLPEVGEIRRSKGSMDGVLFLAMVLEKSRCEGLIDHIAVLRRSKINLCVLLLCLMLGLVQVRCRHNDFYD